MPYNNLEEEYKDGMFVVYSKEAWLEGGFALVFKWTESEINNADERGFIGRKYGINCYLSRPMLVTIV